MMGRNVIRWSKITKSSPDDQQFPSQQMEYLGKVADGAMVFPYGYHGNIPADVLALMVSVQGNPDNRAAIGVIPKDRPKLADGEVAFYHPPTDAFIIWRASGELDIETGSNGTKDINIKTSKLKITGNLEVTGTTTLGTTVTSNGVNIGETHVHTQANDSGGNTEANTGVPQ